MANVDEHVGQYYTQEHTATFLCSLPTAPTTAPDFQAASCTPLYTMLAQVTPMGPKTHEDLAFWRAFLNTSSELKAWVASGRAFVAPPAWPCALPFPPAVTPYVYHTSIMPNATRLGRRAELSHGPHMDVLAGWAAGYPVHPNRHKDMLEAATWLMGQLAFVIWAYNLAVEIVPTPFTGNTKYLRRMALKENLVLKPLMTGKKTLAAALPLWAHNIKTLRAMVPPRGPGTGPSHKKHLDGKVIPGYLPREGDQ
jgi:hypothetical protein